MEYSSARLGVGAATIMPPSGVASCLALAFMSVPVAESMGRGRAGQSWSAIEYYLLRLSKESS